MMKRYLVSALLAVGLLQSAFVQAGPVSGTPGISMPADPKLMVFPFDPNSTYTIIARPNALVDLVLGPDEKLVTMAAGNDIQWVFSKAPGHIFIKPLRSDLYTSATIITTKRTYQLNLRSVSERDYWYQRVSWNYPDLMLLQDSNFAAGSAPSMERPFPKEIGNTPYAGLPSTDSPISLTRSSGQRAPVGYAVTPDKFNHVYTVKGKAEFAPVEVFDDGKFVWMRLEGNQEQPAVFMINNDGDPELVPWVKKGDFIVVQRLVPAVLLKIDNQEVRVVKKGA